MKEKNHTLSKEVKCDKDLESKPVPQTGFKYKYNPKFRIFKL